jgi:DNA-binding CsgD family transcriptional regulator
VRGSTVPHLTPAERQVMHYYASGMSRERIASEMVLSCHTVAMHLRNVKLKLGAQNMAQAGKRYGDIVRDEQRER